MLFGSCFDYLTKMKKLVALLRVKEVGKTLTPRVFEFYKDLDKFIIVF